MSEVLALVESSANQAYIFATNRLRDAIGGSYLIDLVGEEGRRRADAVGAQILLRTSGAVEAKFATSEHAQDWIAEMTRWALEHAPGLSLAGAHTPLADRSLSEARKGVREKLRVTRSLLPDPASRRATLPWLRSCDYTHEPAIDADNPTTPEHARGRRVADSVRRKREWATIEKARERISSELGTKGKFSGQFVHNIEAAYAALAHDDAESSEDTWRAIVHADGNRLGAIFKAFDSLASGLGSEFDSVRSLDKFSTAVDAVTWQAFGHAAQQVDHAIETTIPRSTGKIRPLPIYPLVVGGDDLTVVMDGRYAIFFADVYLKKFTELSASDATIKKVVDAASDTLQAVSFDGCLRACAGVSIFKSHFPFAVAYELAEDLCANAKRHKKARTASLIDWHVVYDASPPSLSSLRDQMNPGHRGRAEPPKLTQRPYAVSTDPAIDANVQALPLEAVVRAADALLAERDGRRSVSATALHDARAALFHDLDTAQRRWRMLTQRHEALREVAAAWGGDASTPYGTYGRCGLLDAMDGIRFFRGLTR